MYISNGFRKTYAEFLAYPGTLQGAAGRMSRVACLRENSPVTWVLCPDLRSHKVQVAGFMESSV